MEREQAIELIRVSTKAQAGDDRYSIPSQQRIVRQIAESRGAQIVHAINYNDVGGGDVMNAPEIRELIFWIRKPEIKAVIIREFSRLIRMDDFTGFKLFNEFADSKTKIYYPGGEIDFSTSQGKIIGSLLGVLGGIEKQELKLKTWEAKERKRELGLDAGGPITWPAGVAFDKKKNLWYWTDEIEKVRRAFRLFLSGETSFSSLEAKTGLTRYNLRTIFSNRIYTGYRVIDSMRNPAKEARYASTDGRQTDRRKMCRDKPIVVHRPELVPIITEEEYARVQEILVRKKQNHWRHRIPDPAHSHFMYRGFIFCAECGAPHYTLSTVIKGRRYDHYVCKRRKGFGEKGCGRITIPPSERCTSAYQDRKRIEPMLDNLFADRLTDEGFIRECIEEAMRERDNTTDGQSIARLRSLIEKLRAKRLRVIQNFEDGDIDRDQKRERVEKVDAEIRATEYALLESAPAHVDIEPVDVASELAPLAEFKSLNTEHKRRILCALDPEIRIANYELKGIFLDLPSFQAFNDGHSGLARQVPAQDLVDLFPRFRRAC